MRCVGGVLGGVPRGSPDVDHYVCVTGLERYEVVTRDFYLVTYELK